MKQIAKIGLATLMLASVAACSSAGDVSMKNVTAAAISQNIHDGVTTAAQVKALYGEPGEVTTEGDSELWIYGYTSGKEDPLSIAQDVTGLGFLGTHSNTKSNILKVTVKNGIVVKHSFTTNHTSGGSDLRAQ